MEATNQRIHTSIPQVPSLRAHRLHLCDHLTALSDCCEYDQTGGLIDITNFVLAV